MSLAETAALASVGASWISAVLAWRAARSSRSAAEQSRSAAQAAERTRLDTLMPEYCVSLLVTAEDCITLRITVLSDRGLLAKFESSGPLPFSGARYIPGREAVGPNTMLGIQGLDDDASSTMVPIDLAHDGTPSKLKLRLRSLGGPVFDAVRLNLIIQSGEIRCNGAPIPRGDDPVMFFAGDSGIDRHYARGGM